MTLYENKMVKGIYWKTLERFGILSIQFVLRITLARLLEPEHYGSLALMMIFITIANLFIQNGFNISLIQNKDVTEEDYSSIIWVSLGITTVIYGLIFLAAPLIAYIYKIEVIVEPLRVLALMLFPGAINSVQLAKISREMDFKKSFYSNLIGNLISGIIGILIAYKGGGLWALVIQSVLNVCITCIVMRFAVKLKIQLICNWIRVKILFSYGWKLVVSTLLNAIVEDIRSLIIGIRFNSDALGNYNQGMQFPQYGVNVIDSSIAGVILPAISKKQSEKDQAKYILKNMVGLSAYIVFPLMAGLAAIAHSFVDILLTDKWMGCVPYMRVYCLVFAFYPINSCNLQAINAMGRSDIFLKLEIIKQGYNFAAIAFAVFFFNSPMAIAISSLFCIPIGLFANAYPNKKILDYSLSEQISDYIQPGIMALVMFGICYSVEQLSFSSAITIFIQIMVGITFYIIASFFLRVSYFLKITEMIRLLIRNKKKDRYIDKV